MTDLYLKSDDEAEMKALLPDFVIDGNWITDDESYQLDIVGTLYKDDAVIGTTPEGLQTIITPATKIEGFHVNLRIWDEELLEKIPDNIIIGAPETPNRVFFD